MRLEFLVPGDERWETFLRDVPHDFYHLPGYVRLAARQEGGRAEAVLVAEAGNYFFLPYLVRGLDGPAGGAESADSPCDVCSPYGYPGPLVREEAAGFLRAALGRWVTALGERAVVSGFFRLHPLLPVSAEPLAEFGNLVHRGTTVSLDLTRSDEAIWSGFRGSHQADIKRSRRKELLVTREHGAGPLDEFASIYRETMDRVGATGFYYFPPTYFEELSEVLGERLSVCAVRRPGGEAVAGALLVECGPIVQYHLGGTRTAALALAPMKFLFDHAWRWAKARGCRVLHLGGGVGSAEDSLFYFKAGFSDRRHPYHTWQVVFRDDLYQSLTARRRATATTAIREGFFPAYRA
jgi:hypothetical protein